MSPSGSAAPRKSLPEVHSVSVGERSVVVRSAGISLKYFGPLQSSPLPSETVREFAFEIPIHPEPETGRHGRVPVDVVGTFVNGLPIYNQFEALSWNGANLWHYDAVVHTAAPGLLEQLAQNGSRHPPLIGFALDGYPVYGPWAGAKSSYRLRSITRRHEFPDGTKLTPEQYGPDVSASAPLGTFAEDYEYVQGAGDLDEYNGRFAETPEYPQGTYAYFLTTDSEGKLAYPYLIGPRFYGCVARALVPAVSRLVSTRLELTTGAKQIEAGRPIRFQLDSARRLRRTDPPFRICARKANSLSGRLRRSRGVRSHPPGTRAGRLLPGRLHVRARRPLSHVGGLFAPRRASAGRSSSQSP